MKVVLAFLALVAVTTAAPQAAAADKPAPPVIDWGKCPQLQPSDAERTSKANVVDKCIQKIPLPTPEESTPEKLAQHRENVTTCALQAEGWFDDKGAYKFDRARQEIINKKLVADVQPVVLGKHDECKKEAIEKFADNFIAQVQMYQACMDFHISQICEIKVQVQGQAAQ